MKLFLNGRIIEPAQARIDPADRGFTLGDGLYETIRAQNGQPLRLDAHLARLRAGATALGIPFPGDNIGQVLQTLLAENNLTAAVFRLTVTRGPTPRGLATPRVVTPTLLITVNPLVGVLPPARAVIAQTTRRNQHSPTARFKTLNGLDNILARREADGRNADDALLLNTAGNLAESTIANLFLVIEGRCTTPQIPDGALPGVMRADILRHTDVAIRSLTPSDLLQASEAFLTNANGIRPLIAVDDRAIGDGHPGPLTRTLMAAIQ